MVTHAAMVIVADIIILLKWMCIVAVLSVLFYFYFINFFLYVSSSQYIFSIYRIFIGYIWVQL